MRFFIKINKKINNEMSRRRMSRLGVGVKPHEGDQAKAKGDWVAIYLIVF